MSRRAPVRPVFFNLTQIQMPVGAITSIMHRVTGVVLAIAIPFCSTHCICRWPARNRTSI